MPGCHSRRRRGVSVVARDARVLRGAAGRRRRDGGRPRAPVSLDRPSRRKKSLGRVPSPARTARAFFRDVPRARRVRRRARADRCRARRVLDQVRVHVPRVRVRRDDRDAHRHRRRRAVLPDLPARLPRARPRVPAGDAGGGVQRRAHHRVLRVLVRAPGVHQARARGLAGLQGVHRRGRALRDRRRARRRVGGPRRAARRVRRAHLGSRRLLVTRRRRNRRNRG